MALLNRAKLYRSTGFLCEQTPQSLILSMENSTEFQLALICEAYIDGLVQDCCNSSAFAVELLQSCTEPSIYPRLFGNTNHSLMSENCVSEYSRIDCVTQPSFHNVRYRLLVARCPTASYFHVTWFYFSCGQSHFAYMRLFNCANKGPNFMID